MRSYQAARSSFNFMEFMARAAILLGICIGFVSVVAINQPWQFGVSVGLAIAGLIAGILVVMMGFFLLVNAQSGRASVDSAEYAQQSLKLARDQFEISKEMLQLAKREAKAPGYDSISAPAGQLQNISFDTNAAAPTAAAAGRTPIEHLGHQIAHTEEGYQVRDKSFPSLIEAKAFVGELIKREREPAPVATADPAE